MATAQLSASYTIVCADSAQYQRALAWLASTAATITSQDENSLTIQFTDDASLEM